MSESPNSARLRRVSDEQPPEPDEHKDVSSLQMMQGLRGGSARDQGGTPHRRARRSRKVEREASTLFQGLIDRGFSAEEAVDVFRYGLEQFDSGYKHALKAQRLVGALRDGFAAQASDKESRGIARAVQDVAFAGASQWGYTRTEAAAILGMGRKRRKLAASSSCGSSTRASFFAPRRKHANAIGFEVKRAIAEFAYCYCKFEEKRFVSTLPAVAVWKLYCQYHDREGHFFPMGRYSHVVTAHAAGGRLRTQYPLRAGAPAFLEWQEQSLEAQVDGVGFGAGWERPISRSKWHELYPQDIAKELWRSCVCHLCSEVEGLINSWGTLMTVVHSNEGAPVRRGEMGRRVNARCADADRCCWCKPKDDPASVQLPDKWPARVKNMVTQPTVAEALQLRLPSLFCGPCGCGCCVEERKQQWRDLGIEEQVSDGSRLSSTHLVRS